MSINSYYKFSSFVLILLSISSFFIGFIYGENSAGAGSFSGDFVGLWKNLQVFLNNDLTTALKFTTELDGDNYRSSRTPLVYIFHAFLDPFAENKIYFIRSVFVLSLSAPILFYLCLREKFKNEQNLLLILISTTLCLSPYFRTSAYWGLEENFGLITLLLAFLFLNKFLSNKHSEWKNFYLLFLTTLFSSLCLYFDQKLTIIPLICFFQIIFSSKSFNLKSFSVLFYFIFSLPYIYLMISWGSIIPSADSLTRRVGSQLNFGNLGYATTIISFYLLPLLFFKKNNFATLFINFFKMKKNYYLIVLFFIYLIYLLFFYDYTSETTLGKGFIHKAGLILFQDYSFQRIFTYVSFFVSWIILLIYLVDSMKDKLIIIYFFLLSIVAWPILQEYFDPVIILMAFTFFGSKLFISYKNSMLLYFYLSILLISSNIYYYNLLN